MHLPTEAANYFLEKAWAKGEKGLTPIQVIKLVYIAHGWNLSYLDRPLINETVEAWKYGPVIPSLYHEFKYFGDEPITRHGTVLFRENGVINSRPTDPDFDESEDAVLNVVFQKYGDMNGLQLSALTHKEGTPWDLIWNKQSGKNRLGVKIPDEIIKEHYNSFLTAPA